MATTTLIRVRDEFGDTVSFRIVNPEQARLRLLSNVKDAMTVTEILAEGNLAEIRTACEREIRAWIIDGKGSEMDKYLSQSEPKQDFPHRLCDPDDLFPAIPEEEEENDHNPTMTRWREYAESLEAEGGDWEAGIVRAAAREWLGRQ